MDRRQQELVDDERLRDRHIVSAWVGVAQRVCGSDDCRDRVKTPTFSHNDQISCVCRESAEDAPLAGLACGALAIPPLEEQARRVLTLLADGQRDAEMARELSLSESAVRKLVQRTVHGSERGLAARRLDRDSQRPAVVAAYGRPSYFLRLGLSFPSASARLRSAGRLLLLSE